MANPNGLRFDIYERVHLPDQVAGIRELEEIELLPRVSMEMRNEYVIIQGDLLLKGTYADVNDQGGKPIEHAIPVEITLPLNRIDNTEEIGVEIENFDVDVISARSLNVSGVLFLSGLKMQNDGTTAESAAETYEETTAQSADETVKAETVLSSEDSVEVSTAEMAADPAGVDEIGENDPDEVVFVHQVDPFPAEDSLDMRNSLGEERQEKKDVQQHQYEEEPQDLPQTELDAVSGGAEPAERKEEKPTEEKAKEEKAKEQKPKVTEMLKEKIKEKFLEKEKSKEGKTAAEQEGNEQQDHILPENTEEKANENIGEENTVSEFMEQAENTEKKPKIAFSGKNEPSDLHKQSSKPAEKSAEQKEQETAQAEKREELSEQTAAETVTSSDLKNLFLSKQPDEHQFRKVKMCIVQKEESLQTIAARYDLNPREIMLYNKLESEELREGQIIYIPK